MAGWSRGPSPCAPERSPPRPGGKPPHPGRSMRPQAPPVLAPLWAPPSPPYGRDGPGAGSRLPAERPEAHGGGMRARGAQLQELARFPPPSRARGLTPAAPRPLPAGAPSAGPRPGSSGPPGPRRRPGDPDRTPPLAALTPRPGAHPARALGRTAPGGRESSPAAQAPLLRGASPAAPPPPPVLRPWARPVSAPPPLWPRTHPRPAHLTSRPRSPSPRRTTVAAPPRCPVGPACPARGGGEVGAPPPAGRGASLNPCAAGRARAAGEAASARRWRPPAPPTPPNLHPPVSTPLSLRRLSLLPAKPGRSAHCTPQPESRRQPAEGGGGSAGGTAARRGGGTHARIVTSSLVAVATPSHRSGSSTS